MKEVKLLLLIILVFNGSQSFAQIEGDDVEMVNDGKPKYELPSTNIEIFGLANWSHTTRVLEENVGLFGDTLGERAKEQPLNIWSYGIGMRSFITENLAWEGGISFIRNGETYDFQGTDTAYSYSTIYRYIGMPVKLNYYTGDNVRFIASIGIVPQMFLAYKQHREWTDSVDHTDSEDYETKSGYNSFVVSGVVNAGVQFKMNGRYYVSIIPEFRYQLTNTYEKTDSYKHFSRALGFNIGLSYLL